jgi:group I intron endonuclease
MFIYKITNIITQKIYVGQTKRTIQNRFKSHISEAMRNLYDTYLHRSIRKYGKENFIVEMVEECNHDNIAEREIFWIQTLNAKAPNGYNLHDGGRGGCLSPSDELRQKLSNAKKGKVPWNKGKTGVQHYSKRPFKERKKRAKPKQLNICPACHKLHINKKYCSKKCHWSHKEAWNRGKTKHTHPELKHKLSGGKCFHKSKNGPVI